MSTMLEAAVETVETASDCSSMSLKGVLMIALPECNQCLENLHSLPAVQNSFKVEFEKGLKIRGRFNKGERRPREIITSVCQVNRAVYDVMQTVGKDLYLLNSPFVDIGENKVDPLRDSRVHTLLRRFGMEHCCVTPWSFGEVGVEEHRLNHPQSLQTLRDNFLYQTGEVGV